MPSWILKLTKTVSAREDGFLRLTSGAGVEMDISEEDPGENVRNELKIRK